MADKMFTSFEDLTSQLIRKFNVLERIEKSCCGITLSQCYTTKFLAQKGKASMKELSQEIGVTVSTMTRILDVMVRDGLVERENDSKDRRKVYIQLTKKGQELYSQIKQFSEIYLSKIFNDIPEEKQQSIIEALEILLKAMNSFESYCK